MPKRGRGSSNITGSWIEERGREIKVTERRGKLARGRAECSVYGKIRIGWLVLGYYMVLVIGYYPLNHNEKRWVLPIHMIPPNTRSGTTHTSQYNPVFLN